MISVGTPIIVETNRSVYGSVRTTNSVIGIFHGTISGDKIKAWTRNMGVVTRKREYCYDLAKNPLTENLKNVICPSWETIMLKTLIVKSDYRHENLVDYADKSKVAHLLDYPMAEWGEAAKFVKDMPPKACKLTSRGTIMTPDGLFIRISWNQDIEVTASDPAREECVDYDPATWGEASHKRSVDLINDLILQYKAVMSKQ